MDAPRIALISLHTSPLESPGAGDAGGMNVYVASVGDELARRGWDVETLTRRTSADQPATFRRPSGAIIRFLDAGDPGPIAKEDLAATTGQFTEKLAELPRFDLMHSHYWLSGAAALPVALGSGIPHILSLHTVAAQKNANLAPGQQPEPESRVSAEMELANLSTLMIASSESEAGALATYYDVSRARIAVVRPGVDTGLFHPRPAGEVAIQRWMRPTIIAVGRVQPLKGQEIAIRAVAEIPPGSRPVLRLIGGDSGAGDSYSERLRTLVAELGIEPAVQFTGPLPRSAVAEAMRDAALVLVPSAAETYGLVALEAAASGTPVVASRVPGLSEAVVEGVTGTFARAGDPSDWASTINALLTDRARLARLASSAADYGKQHDWGSTAETLACHYLQLTGRHHPPRADT